MTGADYIAEFLKQRNADRVFLVTGGACAFMIDAIARHPGMSYVCVQHEQAAAIAADAVWRVDHSRVGVTMATSGPGATNLVTGIGCSFFDSIPSIHITGQVNKAESVSFFGAQLRQAGFQETDIVEMVKPITKYAVQVNTIAELKHELTKAYNLAITGRMGPVLLDVPMNIQQEEAGDTIEYEPPQEAQKSFAQLEIAEKLKAELEQFFAASERPLVLFGAGVGLAGVEKEVLQWLETAKIPFLSSWNGMSYFNHDSPAYHGQIGVYGNRGSNYIVQNCDALLVLGNRMDTRQRPGNTKAFAPQATVHVIDIDQEELKKYKINAYATTQLNLKDLPPILEHLSPPPLQPEWRHYLKEMKEKYFGNNPSTFAKEQGSLSPYLVVERINRMIEENAVVIVGCGGISCWAYQAFHSTKHTLFTSGGMAPMGYTAPAAIGANFTAPERQVICFEGDGGFQMNIQELQTIRYNNLNIKIVILNNGGYGIIKQFQDSNFEGRYEASGKGYSVPDFEAIVTAYKIPYKRVEHQEDLTEDLFASQGPLVVDVILHPNTLIEPKREMGRPINDQFPYASDQEFAQGNRFVAHQREKN